MNLQTVCILDYETKNPPGDLRTDVHIIEDVSADYFFFAALASSNAAWAAAKRATGTR